ncbi:hypothetical protein ACHAW5_002036 [Stephanodiscus triporus]|uniref:Uncharacterized protein n=1 Tax=Stephanodiscus triporus TaxID=2934178 RepID=A0ABD3QKX7_9STRA
MRRRSTTTMAVAATLATVAACRGMESAAAAFVVVVVPPRSSSSHSTSTTTGRRRTTASTSMTGGGIDRASAAAAASGEDRRNNRPLLDEAFSGLDDADKYETVLSGLCAKIVDDGSENNAKSSIVDPMRLLGEMNALGISMGPRGTVGLIDATALSSDARIMAEVLSLAKRNGAISRYGCLQGDVDPVPRSSSSFNSNSNSNSFSFGGGGGDGDRERRIRRLASLPPVPDDDRATEVANAATFAIAIASCMFVEAFAGPFHLDGLAPWANVAIFVAVTILVLDNLFDAIVGSTTLLVRMKDGDGITDVLADAARGAGSGSSTSSSQSTIVRKEDMPLGIGTGKMTGSVFRGFGRLLSDDTERDCMCEAAAVFAAYGLGLPCFAFRPNAREGAALVLQSMRGEGEGGETNEDGGGYDRDRRRRRRRSTTMDCLASDVGLMKVMVWLMAPVAMELSRYPRLMSSEPREASGFLDRLASASASTMASGGGSSPGTLSALADALPADDEERDAYLRWALAEADVLLRRNAKVVDSLSGALAGGAATAGDCVAILEGF